MQQKTKEALAIVKPDQENAYKQPPVIPEHKMISIIVTRNPENGILYTAFPTQSMFSSVSAIQHYNAISKIIVTLCVRASQMPLIGYFDGYARTVCNQICESP